MTQVNVFTSEPVPCHSFSPDRSKVAISPNNNEVHIFKKDNSKWLQETVLSQHDLRVTSIDWAQKTNKIVSCSADKNAYVWSLDNGVWKPTLVILRIHRAATVVRWSPNADKFAVGSGDRTISVCFFEEANDWWICKHIKKPIKSTVTCLDWHHNNILLACGSTDYRARIFSAYVKEVDSANPEPSEWSSKPTASTGNLIGEWTTGGGGWVHGVAFSPDGSKLAWVSHDSSISVVDAKKNQAFITVKTPDLPYLTLIWSSNRFIIAAGHDCCPMLYKYDENSGKLECLEKLDKSTKKETDGFSAMRKFRELDKFAISLNDNSSSDSISDTIHQNSIREIRAHSLSKSGGVDRISTVGLDGKMVFWDTSRYV
ncbi:actin-related protein 2/3 complex subunit 1A [Tetranychus urticae]|uniref:Actin-related protein 2/3 complex subunit n=1 Tax=Tetranychus urticae TaxID=32264 RepID=T1L1Z1_TETUR|nr:actin-related protein 2/3 complex subunit 1A [Tetranychus urticae]